MISVDKHLERFIVAHRVGFFDWFFIGLSWVGTLGLVWVVIAAVLALFWRPPWIFVSVVSADAVADLLSGFGKDLVPRRRPFVTQLGPKTTTHFFPSGPRGNELRLRNGALRRGAASARSVLRPCRADRLLASLQRRPLPA